MFQKASRGGLAGGLREDCARPGGAGGSHAARLERSGLPSNPQFHPPPARCCTFCLIVPSPPSLPLPPPQYFVDRLRWCTYVVFTELLMLGQCIPGGWPSAALWQLRRRPLAAAAGAGRCLGGPRRSTAGGARTWWHPQQPAQLQQQPARQRRAGVLTNQPPPSLSCPHLQHRPHLHPDGVCRRRAEAGAERRHGVGRAVPGGGGGAAGPGSQAAVGRRQRFGPAVAAAMRLLARPVHPPACRPARLLSHPI